MSFIRLGKSLDDINETSVAPEGNYDLVIRAVDIHEKNGRESLKVTLVFDAEPDIEPFTIFLSIPSGDDDDTVATRKLRRLKRFLTMVGYEGEMDTLETEDLVGLMFRGSVVQEAMTDRDGKETGDMRNNLIIPKIR